ncbi:MAG: hypothetical protein DWQ01_06325 [Planctomycetota bacterium]|nr:MAG: hypothetical protein DWQ01_06325 [Planctomycetota bacterium]
MSFRLLPCVFGLGALLLAGCSSSGSFGDAPASVLDRDVELPRAVEARNFTILAPGVAGAGQPDLATIESLPTKGYRTLINLRTSGERYPAEEAETAEAAGLHYVEIPVSSRTFGLLQAKQLEEALEGAPEGAVFIHCGSGNRVGALWGLYRGLVEGLAPSEAVAAGYRAGMRSSSLAAGIDHSLSEALSQ